MAIRSRAAPDTGYKILGFDAVGRVTAAGRDVTLFQPGDEVFYAGDITRPGTNAALHLVDERIVGRKPEKLSDAEAAAIPLTAITAWEILFEKFRIPEGGGDGDALLIIGGAGGVGSMLIQIAKHLTNLKVIATASRPETVAWCKKMGADAVVNHRETLKTQLDTLGLSIRYVASLTASEVHFEGMVDLIRPKGEICMIDDPVGLDFTLMKRKSLTLHWELMFTRSIFQTDDMIEQNKLLNRVSALMDCGQLQTTMTQSLGTINAENLRKAHVMQESGSTIGKTVLEGFAKPGQTKLT